MIHFSLLHSVRKFQMMKQKSADNGGESIIFGPDGLIA